MFGSALHCSRSFSRGTSPLLHACASGVEPLLSLRLTMTCHSRGLSDRTASAASIRPTAQASANGVWPFLSMRCRSAFARNSSRTTPCMRPPSCRAGGRGGPRGRCKHARCNGVRWFWSSALTSAPPRQRRLTNSTCPFIAAMWRAVRSDPLRFSLSFSFSFCFFLLIFPSSPFAPLASAVLSPGRRMIFTSALSSSNFPPPGPWRCFASSPTLPRSSPSPSFPLLSGSGGVSTGVSSCSITASSFVTSFRLPWIRVKKSQTFLVGLRSISSTRTSPVAAAA
mmetsp:Transcript_6719/g.16454  ORF Transcript_6719/g.16454 Transcript_6719/m.16454 type:complete len:282 (-) Transcript_6719:644-1489(-)